MSFSDLQKETALNLLKAFLENGSKVTHQGYIYPFLNFNQQRLEGLPPIQKMINDFLSKKIDLEKLKEQNEIFNRKYDYWGYKGFSGQLMINQMVKWSNQSIEMESLFRDCLVLPTGKDVAGKAITIFAKTAPKLVPDLIGFRSGAVPYMLSYFWQIQKPEFIPVQYSSAKTTLLENDLIESKMDISDFYKAYWEVNDELAEIFKKEIVDSNIPKYWFVEHVLLPRVLLR